MGDSSTPPVASGARVFYSCAAGPDQALCADLEKHLAILRNQGTVAEWHARMVLPGMDRREEAERHLRQAEIILMLLSADYVASAYCHDVEAKIALDRHDRGEAWAIPVLLRPVYLHETPFSRMQALPSNAQPVTLWRNRDLAWVDVVQGIRRAVAGLPARVPARGPLAGVEQDEGGAALYLCSELLDFCVPLRLSLEKPAGIHLDRIVRGLGLPERLTHKGRMGVSFRYQLAYDDRVLSRVQTMAEQGVRGDGVLVLEVVVSPLAATAPDREEDGALVYKSGDTVGRDEAIGWLRGQLSGAGW